MTAAVTMLVKKFQSFPQQMYHVMCRRGRIRELLDRPWIDSDANLAFSCGRRRMQTRLTEVVNYTRT